MWRCLCACYFLAYLLASGQIWKLRNPKASLKAGETYIILLTNITLISVISKKIKLVTEPEL